MSIIEIKNLTKYYGKNRGVEDVSLTISKGEIFGFIGPNGAGKSTTIRALLGFIKMSSGSANILGMDCEKESPQIKKHIGYLPSEVNYYDDMKVKKILEYSSRFYNIDASKKIDELCKYFELDYNKRIDELSYGNKKKVAIIQSLIHNPNILIMDEPTGGLDPLMQNKFFDLLKEQNKKGTTIFFSSHILNEVQRMCDRVAIIKEGKILKIERIEDLRRAKYKKVKIDLDDNNKDQQISLSGVSNLTKHNDKIEFLYNGPIADLINELSVLKIDNVWIEEPSLEDIFLHYYLKEDE